MKKKSIIVLSLGILLTVCVLLGLSYAYWRYTISQNNKNLVVTDCFEITFQGENDIHLTNTYPMNRVELEAFLQNNSPYHFTVTNKCSSVASVGINLEVLEAEGGKILSDQYIDVLLVDGATPIKDIIEDKYNVHFWNIFNEQHELEYNLTNYPVNSEKVIPEATTAYNMYNFILEGNTSREFNLFIFMDQKTPPTNDVMNATFQSKVTLSAGYQQQKETLSLLQKSCSNRKGASATCEDTALQQSNYGNNATKIIIQNELNPIPNAIATYDESYNDDNSVISYVVENEKVSESDPTTYTIYLQGRGSITLPPDSRDMFSKMEKVTEIEGIEYLDTSNVTNMYMMFRKMTNLKSLDLSNFDTSNVTTMAYMFDNMSSLTNLDLSSFNTSNVTTMNSMFASVSSLNSLDLSSFNTSNVTDMASMFAFMSSLMSVNLRNFDTSKVTTMLWMFNNTPKLKSLDLSHFNTSNVTTMTAMFASMSSLTSLDISSFNTSKVKDMSWMFYELENLTSLDVNHFNTSNVTNMSYMFASMSGLTSLDLSSFNISNVTNMSYMFAFMYSLTNLDLSSFNINNVTNMSYMFAYMSSLTSLDISHFDTNKATDMSSMFEKSEKLTNISYGNSFVHANNALVTKMFGNCPANKPTDPSWAGVV